MHGHPHTCSYCSRGFKRAEHLTRHLRTHTREKPFQCHCGAAFTRRDLLTRHWRITNHSNNTGTVESISSPSTARGVAPEPQYQHPPREANDAVTSLNIPNERCFDPISHVNTASSHFALANSQVRFEATAPIATLGDTQLDVVGQDVVPQPYFDEGFEDFRGFVNFIDGVGLSAQWTPEYDIDWLRVDSSHHDSRRHSRELSAAQSPSLEHIGSPFSTWLPSAPGDEQAHLRSQTGDDLREQRTQHGTYNVTDDYRSFLVSLLKSFPAPISEFEIPSRHALTRYITAFFTGFHSHFPFIHEPTYKPSCSPLELTLSMCAAGAQYCFERRSSERLFSVAKGIVFERLRQEESHFGPQTLAFIASTNILSPEAPRITRRSGPWAPLDMAKTLLILVGFATWERKDLLQQAFALRGLLVQCLRDNGLREDETPLSITTSKSIMWDQWVQRESSRRTKLVAFCYINVHSIAYNVHPLLWSNELHLRLPCRTPDWKAPSATRWMALQQEGKADQMPFQEALSILLQGASSTDSVHPIPSPIGNYVLLHALLQRIHVVRELAFPAVASATISATELQTIGRALRSWTSLWQQTPESMLDPNNESGPIPFTSSALLVVAYIRLSLNVGSHCPLETRDPDVIAAALARLPDIERNDNLLSALLYSTHALSIPVRLGIDRVARSQAFFWSVQHAISSFESAIFLSKWLCSLPRPIHEDSVSRSEHRILHWLHCIVREAYAVVDFDEEDGGGDELEVSNDPFHLGLAVLKIWCRFFRGNTQWQFVVNLGLSLEKFMTSIR